MTPPLFFDRSLSHACADCSTRELAPRRVVPLRASGCARRLMLAVGASNGSRNLTHERGEVPNGEKRRKEKGRQEALGPLPGGGPSTGRLLCCTFYFYFLLLLSTFHFLLSIFYFPSTPSQIRIR